MAKSIIWGSGKVETADLPQGEDAALCYEEGTSIRAHMPSSQRLSDPHLCELQCLPPSFHHLELSLSFLALFFFSLILNIF